MAYDVGGGGGTAGAITEGTRFSLSKPYELIGEVTPETLRQLNEMLTELYSAANRVDEVGLQGPSSATDGNLAVFDGTTGQKLRDGGVLTTDVLISRVVLTDAQIKSGNSSPVTVIAAPGANKHIVILGCALIKDASNGAYSAAPSFSLRHSGIGTDITTALNITLSTGDKRWIRPAVGAVTITSDPSNTAVVAFLTADVTGGNAANYLVVEAMYTIVDDNV